MRNPSLFRLPILVLVLFFLYPGPARSQVFMDKEEALKTAFPDATRVDHKTVFFTDEERDNLRKLAKATWGERLYTYYMGYQGDTLMGFAVIDTHVVRTKTETVLVVMSPDGKIEKIQLLAFYEPTEYMAHPGWIQKLVGKTIADPIQLRRDVDTITGATISSDAITTMTRKVLAFHELFLKPTLAK